MINSRLRARSSPLPPAPGPDRGPCHQSRAGEADDNGDHRGFRPERAAGEELGPRQRKVQHPGHLEAGDGGAEDASLREIPAEMDADGKPQAACGRIGEAEQHPGLERDRDRADHRGAGIGPMQDAEQRGRYDHRRERAEALLEHAVNPAAHDDLLADRGAERDGERARHVVQSREALVAGEPARPEDRVDRAEQRGAEQQSPWDLTGGAVERELAGRASLDQAHKQTIGRDDDHADHGLHGDQCPRARG